MELGLRGKSVMVTGGSRGIGKAAARAFAAEGARVALTYATDRAAADQAVEEVEAAGASAVACELRLGDAGSIRSAVDSATRAHGGLDVLVCNAVRWPHDVKEQLRESNPETWARIVRENVEGTAACVREALPHLTRSSAGRVVLVSSPVSHAGLPGASAYTAAKAALEGLAATLKQEAGADGILVNVISPGVTVTEAHLADLGADVLESFRERTPTGRLSEPDDIAAVIVFLCSEANRNINGAYLPIDGGIS